MYRSSTTRRQPRLCAFPSIDADADADANHIAATLTAAVPEPASSLAVLVPALLAARRQRRA